MNERSSRFYSPNRRLKEAGEGGSVETVPSLPATCVESIRMGEGRESSENRNKKQDNFLFFFIRQISFGIFRFIERMSIEFEFFTPNQIF